jgi:hypothetical protein
MTSHPPTGPELAANKAVVQRLVDEVLNGRNLDLIDDSPAPPPTPAPGSGTHPPDAGSSPSMKSTATGSTMAALQRPGHSKTTSTASPNSAYPPPPICANRIGGLTATPCKRVRTSAQPTSNIDTAGRRHTDH